jgi:hypothetical protein
VSFCLLCIPADKFFAEPFWVQNLFQAKKETLLVWDKRGKKEADNSTNKKI